MKATEILQSVFWMHQQFMQHLQANYRRLSTEDYYMMEKLFKDVCELVKVALRSEERISSMV